MNKIVTVLLTFLLFVNSSSGQLVSFSPRIIDDLVKPQISFNSLKRSAQSPTNCGRDTVEYPFYKRSGYSFVQVNKGRGLGQLYSTPRPLTLHGFSFYAVVATNPPTNKKVRLICNVYKAGMDSLPKGKSLRSDTMTIDTNFYNGLLSKMVRHATFKKPLFLDSAYIITVESDSALLNTYILGNSFTLRDGKKENLNCGSISGTWYNGKNLNVGGVPFDADLFLHPHVQYSLGADFTIKNPCYNVADTVRFTNLSIKNMAGSKMYNRYLLYNFAYYCNWWTTGNGTGYTFSVDHKVKYSQRQNYKIQLISTVYGYRGMENGCSDTTEKWLYYKPDFPQVSGPSNACIGDTAKFTVTNNDTGSVYEWYKKTTDAIPFFKGKLYNKFPLVKTDTFYLRANNHGCVSNFRTLILNVNAYPATLTVKNDSICAGSKANLSGFTNIGNIEWFETNNSSAVLYTGNVFQTPVLSKDTFFYVHANNKGCLKSPRVKVSALVGSNFAPIAPAISRDTSICIASTSLLTLTAIAGAGLTVRWFDAGSGGVGISTGNSYFFIPSKREVKTIYADAYNGVCGSTRVPVVITIEDYPKILKIISDTICKGDSLIMSVNLPFGGAAWYSAATGGSLLHNGARYVLMPAVSSDYFVETKSGICKSPFRTVLNGTVNTFPVVVKVWGDTICAKNKATLKSKLTGPGTMYWFEYDTSAVALGKGTTFQTQVLNGSKAFYGQPEYAGCYGPKQLVSPLVKPIPFAGFSYEIYPHNQSVKVSPIDAVGSTVLWNFGDGKSSAVNIVTHFFSGPGTYRIKLTLTGKNGCQDSFVNTVNIGAGAIQATRNLPVLKVYPNPSNNELNVELKNNPGNIHVSIYSVNGMLIIDENKIIDNKLMKFDVNGLGAGMYLLKIDGYRAIVFIKE